MQNINTYHLGISRNALHHGPRVHPAHFFEMEQLHAKSIVLNLFCRNCHIVSSVIRPHRSIRASIPEIFNSFCLSIKLCVAIFVQFLIFKRSQFFLLLSYFHQNLAQSKILNFIFYLLKVEPFLSFKKDVKS